MEKYTQTSGLNQSKLQYLAKNTALYTLASFGSKMVSFLLLPLYTNVLSPGEYGTADIIVLSASVLAAIFSLNMSDVVIRFAIDKEYNNKEVFSFCLKIAGFGLMLLSCLIIGFKLTGYVDWPDIYFFFLIAISASTALEGLFYQYLRAIDMVAASAIGSTLGAVARPVLCVVFLLVFRMGLKGYLLSLLLGSVVVIIYSVYSLLRAHQLVLLPVCNSSVKGEMIRYGLMGLANTLSYWAAQGVDKYCILYFQGAELNGLYAISYKISIFLTIFSDIFGKAWGISAIKEFDPEDGDHFFADIYSIYNSGLCIMCSVLILVNVMFSKVMLADSFFDAWKYASFLLVASLFNALAQHLGGVYGAVKDLKILVISTCSSVVVNLILNLLLIPKFGGIGAAFATMSSMYCIFMIRYINLRKHIHMYVKTRRNYVMYGLLLMQILLDHQKGHLYFFQILIVCIMVLLNIDECKKVYRKIQGLLYKIRNKKMDSDHR